MAEATVIEKERNPYTGMDKATSDNGNGEAMKVEDLINSGHPEWKQYEPVDTLTNADGEMANLHERLSANPPAPEVNKTIKYEDYLNTTAEPVADHYENLQLKDDQLISDLTGVLNM